QRRRAQSLSHAADLARTDETQQTCIGKRVQGRAWERSILVNLDRVRRDFIAHDRFQQFQRIDLDSCFVHPQLLVLQSGLTLARDSIARKSYKNLKFVTSF